MDLARQRLEDLRRYDKDTPTLVKDLWFEYAQEKENRYKDLEYMWRSLSPHFGHLRPDQITRETCKDFMMSKNVKAGTVIRQLGALRAAIKWGDPHSPAEFWFPPTPPPRDRYLTRTEVETLLSVCTEPHIYLYIVLAICTGGRKSAILQLTWDRVDFERRLINLGVGEANKRRAIVPMNATAERALENAFTYRLTDNVIEYNGKPIKDIKRGFARCVKKASLKGGVSPHTLRHTAAVWMAENRVPMSEIAQYLGHENTRITERVYARYSPDFLKTAANSLEMSSIELKKGNIIEC